MFQIFTIFIVYFTKLNQPKRVLFVQKNSKYYRKAKALKTKEVKTIMRTAKKTTAHKRAKTANTKMETSSRVGKTTRSRSKTTRAKNCGK